MMIILKLIFVILLIVTLIYCNTSTPFWNEKIKVTMCSKYVLPGLADLLVIVKETNYLKKLIVKLRQKLQQERFIKNKKSPF